MYPDNIRIRPEKPLGDEVAFVQKNGIFIAMKKIRVKNSGIVKLQFFDDFPDGNLIIGQVGKEIHFDIKRFYCINNLFNDKTIRGKHAHKKTEQCIFCLNGRFSLEIDDGKNKQVITMDSPYWGVRLGKMLWHNMKNFSHDCVILVVANNYYKKDDYIRDYKEFLRLVKYKAKLKK